MWVIRTCLGIMFTSSEVEDEIPRTTKMRDRWRAAMERSAWTRTVICCSSFKEGSQRWSRKRDRRWNVEKLAGNENSQLKVSVCCRSWSYCVANEQTSAISNNKPQEYSWGVELLFSVTCVQYSQIYHPQDSGVIFFIWYKDTVAVARTSDSW